MIRIIAGSLKGRKLKVPDGAEVRPTTDRMRERTFSILHHHRYPDLYQARVADFFAGTGALGIEALSRGAGFACFLEQAPAAISSLLSNLNTLALLPNTTLLTRDATNPGKAEKPFDIIFMDAPYNKGLTQKALTGVANGTWLASDGVIVAEVHKDEAPSLPAGFQLVDERIQGIQKTLFIMHLQAD